MKKMLIAVLVFLLAMPAAWASSLFSLPNTTKTEEETAPSYGVMADVSPDSTKTLKDGTRVQVYQEVSGNAYLDFGSLLAERGYGVEAQSVDGNVVSVVVSKDDIFFRVDYDQKKAQLTVSYPADVKIEEKDFFEDYIEVEYGESFKLSGLAKITPRNFGSNKFIGGSYPVITADIQNISNKTLYTSTGISVRLHIVNEDNHYIYDMKDSGKKYVLSSGSLTLQAGVLDPLETESITYSFKISSSSLNHTEGTVAVTFEQQGEKYVIYVREGK